MRRPLDTSELAFYEASRRAVTNCVIVIHVVGALDPEALRSAIDRVQARHPLLRARVEPGGIPRLVDDQVPPIPLAVIDDGEPGAWVARVSEELSTPVPFARGPLARFTQVRGDGGSTVILTFTHLIGDGFSGAAIHRDLMQALREPRRALAPLPERPPLGHQLTQIGAALPGLGLVGQALDVAADSLALAAQHLGAGVVGSPRAGGVRHRASSTTLDPAETAALLERCRAADVSVYGLLCATLLAEIAGHRGARSRILLSTPINIRSIFDPPVDDDVGVYAYAPALSFNVRPGEPPWPLARTVVGKVRWARRLFAPRVAGLSMRALRPFVGPVVGAPAPSWGAPAASVVASNVGRIAELRGPPGIEVTHASMFAMLPGIDLVMVSQSYAGRMILNFIRSEPAARPGLAEAAEARVLAALRRREGAAQR